MKLSPHEIDKLKLHNVSHLCQRRLAKGQRLNIPEATALIVTCIMELAFSGSHSVAQLMNLGKHILGHRQVMPGVSAILDEVQIEATFPDGTKLVTVHHPICQKDGNLELALSGSGLTLPDLSLFDTSPHARSLNTLSKLERPLVPGEVIVSPEAVDIELNAGRENILLDVFNSSDRPIQVGSHYHFIESNPFLKFDRIASYGKRLNIAAGTAIRFEPGESKTENDENDPRWDDLKKLLTDK